MSIGTPITHVTYGQYVQNLLSDVSVELGRDVSGFTQYSDYFEAWDSWIQYTWQVTLRNDAVVTYDKLTDIENAVGDVVSQIQSLQIQLQSFNGIDFGQVTGKLDEVIATLGGFTPTNIQALVDKLEEIRVLLEGIVPSDFGALVSAVETLDADTGAELEAGFALVNGSLGQVISLLQSGGGGGGGADVSGSLDAINLTLANASTGNVAGLYAVARALEGFVTAAIEQTDEDLTFSLNSIAIALQQLATQGGRGDSVSLTDWLLRISKGQATETDLKVTTVDPISPWLQDEGSAWVKVVQKLLPVLSAVIPLALVDSDALGDLLKPLFTSVVNHYQAKIQSLGEIGPNAGFEAASVFLQEAVSFGLKAHLVAVGAEAAASYSKFVGIPQIAAFLSDLAAFAPIARETWGRAIGQAVGRPSEYELNAITHSKLPDERDLREAFTKRVLSEQSYRELLSFHGYSPAYQQDFVDHAWRPPRLREIVLLASDSAVTTDEAREWLRFAGYRDDHVDKWLPILLAQAIKGQRQALINEVTTSLKDGVISEDDAELEWDRVDLPDPARAFLKRSAFLAFRREQIKDQSAVLEYQAINNQITVSEYELALRALGVDYRRAAIMLNKVEARLAAKVAQEEKRETEAETRKVQALAIQRWKDAFEAGFVTAADLEAALEQIGLTQAIAQETVALEEIRLAARTERDRTATTQRTLARETRERVEAFIELFRKDQIESEDLFVALTNLGLSQDEAQAIVTRESALKIPTPPRRIEPPAQVKARELRERARTALLIEFRKGFISSNVLWDGLVQLGEDVDLARADVEIEVLKRRKEAQPPANPDLDPLALAAKRREIRAAQDAFIRGIITIAALADSLARFVLDDDVRQALIEEAVFEKSLRATAPAP